MFLYMQIQLTIGLDPVTPLKVTDFDFISFATSIAASSPKSHSVVDQLMIAHLDNSKICATTPIFMSCNLFSFLHFFPELTKQFTIGLERQINSVVNFDIIYTDAPLLTNFKLMNFQAYERRGL